MDAHAENNDKVMISLDYPKVVLFIIINIIIQIMNQKIAQNYL